MITALFLVAAVILVAFGGLMAAVDSAITAQSRSDISELAATSRAAKSLRAIAEDPGAHTNAVNFVRITSESTAAVLVTLAFMQIFDQLWLALVVSALIMTAVSFVLVGVSPRSVGRAHATATIRLTAPMVHFVRVILGPIAAGLVLLGNKVTPGVAREATFSSEEQLLSMVDEATELDVLEEDNRELIHSIFEFNETVIREVMVPRTDMVTIDTSASVDSALGLFFSRGVSRVPIINHEVDDVVGILYLRDVARFSHERGAADQNATVGTLGRAAVFVPESMKANDLLSHMQLESNHLAMVVDEYGGIAGLCTMEDLIEELVGDISDEYDREVVEVEDLGNQRYRVSARLPVDELGELFGLSLDDDDVDSVGGLLAKTLGRLPVRGSVAHISGLILTADRTEGRRKRLTTVLVERDTSLIEFQEAFGNKPGEQKADDRG